MSALLTRTASGRWDVLKRLAHGDALRKRSG